MRKSIPVAFFSLMSTLLIFGTVVMGGSELVLFSRYFAQERYDTLDEVVNVAQRTASYLVQEASLPEGEELEALSTKLEIIGESAEAYLFFTDCDGNVMLASVPEKLTGDTVEAEVLEKAGKAKENYHLFDTLDGVLAEKSYISVREMRSEDGACTGYLFLCSSGERLAEFRREFFSNFFLSACLMLLLASVLTKVMMHKLTDPLQKVTDAAQRFGGGDLSVRVEGVDGEKIVTYKDKYVNGDLDSSETVNEKITKQMVTEVILKGRVKRVKNIRLKTHTPISELKVPARVQLDANGVPKNYKRIVDGTATAYYGGTGTASGRKPMPGHIAVNPKQFPYGTELYIVSLDGKFVYGYCIAADTGGFAKRNSCTVDLYMNTYEECCAWGYRGVRIYVL